MNSENAMQYQIVDATSIAALMTNVNRAIRAGWEPVGGVTQFGEKIMQAMVIPVTKQTRWNYVNWNYKDRVIAAQLGVTVEAVKYQRGKREVDRLVPAQKP